MATGTATLDFGSTPIDTATILVSGQSGLTSASFLEAFWMQETTADNGVDEHAEGSSLCPLTCEFVNSSSFNINAHTLAMLGVGQFKVRWVTA